MSPEIAESFAQKMSEGFWTLHYPITADKTSSFGLPITDALPPDVYDLMQLYPQPAQRRPSVEFTPTPYRPAPVRSSGSER